MMSPENLESKWRTEKNTPVKKNPPAFVRVKAPEGSEVAKLMEGGMGCEPHANQEVGVSRPKLGYLGSPLNHK
mgnify:CR=1 FL=1